MKEEIVLFKIHNGLKDGKNHYEATRKHWRMSNKRIEYIQYAVGINRGKVECAFQPSKWSIVEDGEDKGRLFFEGDEATYDFLYKLQVAEEQLLKKFGSGNPVAYISLSELN